MSVVVCVCWGAVVFFFFKQKTAYERRISDWSSDVCSSDLLCGGGPFAFRMIRCGRRFESLPSRYLTCREGQGAVRQVGVGKDVDLGAADAFRSEEHTSELQSLMRISYAVFCLKKKKNTRNNKTTL